MSELGRALAAPGCLTVKPTDRRAGRIGAVGLSDSDKANQILSFIEPRYKHPIVAADGRLGGEKTAARAFRCYIRAGGCLTQPESVGGRLGSVRVLGAAAIMREIVHLQAGQCGNQIGAKVRAGKEGAGAGGERARSGAAAADALLFGSSGR